MHLTVPVVDNQDQIGSALTAVTPDRSGGLWAVGWSQRAGATRMPTALHRTNSTPAGLPSPLVPGRSRALA